MSASAGHDHSIPVTIPPGHDALGVLREIVGDRCEVSEAGVSLFVWELGKYLGWERRKGRPPVQQTTHEGSKVPRHVVARGRVRVDLAHGEITAHNIPAELVQEILQTVEELLDPLAEDR